MLDDAIWNKLVKLKPSLPRSAHVQQRYYGEDLWYILNDKSSGKFHRFNRTAYLFLGFMDGLSNLDNILSSVKSVCAEKGLEDQSNKEDLIELLQYLYVADLLVCDFTPSTEEMFNRNQRKKDMFWQQLIKNPYVWKFTLFNPDRLLDSLMPLARLLASPAMAFTWLIVVAYACLQAGNHWPEISGSSFDHILSAQNLFLLWLIYPVLKVVHELGHGLFTKVWGGNIHEFGVVFILGTPLPYVDATSATAFPKKQRLMVGAAGMAVELFFAALALIVWININDGLLRDICFNIMLIGSVSTLFFNGNPLMKFDGYHIMCDAIDQPNLAARAIQQLRYLVRHYGYNIATTISPSLNRGESWGLTIYGCLAFLYRLLILLSIVVIVSNNFPTIGLVFGLWLGFFQFVLPVAKHGVYLFLSKDLEQHRFRAISVTITILLGFIIAVFAAPVSYKTSAQGVVWLQKDARIQSESAGEVVEYLVADGAEIVEGQVIARLSNEDLLASLRKKKSYLVEFQARYEEAWSQDHSQSRLFQQDIEVIVSEIALLERRVAHLLIRSPSTGVFKAVFHHNILGSFIRQGDTIGLVLADQQPRIRVAVTQQEIGLIKADIKRVEVQLLSDPSIIYEATISQEVPKATYVLPSPALGTAGGGRIIIDATADGNVTASERIFIIDISLTSKTLDSHYYGMRTHVVFLHTPEVVFKQVLRTVRQAFIDIVRSD